jgi:alpha-tubulin suppressor-like RCC1 family protein
MANRVCTRFEDTDGLDLGCHLVTKEYLLEAYPSLVPWMKAPALWLWGCGASGTLGTNSIAGQSSPVQTISGGTSWRSISNDGSTMAAIKTDGTLWMWGSAATGALGNNSATNQSSPVQTISGGNNWKSVSGGGAAIKTDGTLWLWGNTQVGRIGDNTQINRSSPVQTISGGTNWKSVSAGAEHTAAIKNDGTLWLWGQTQNGRLGNNSITTPRSSPVQTISGGTNWKSVTAGSAHTAAIKTDGTLWLWGYGGSGALGNNSTISHSSPVQTISGGTNWKSAGLTYAIKTDGTLWLWGYGGSGALGNNSTANQSSPVQTVSGGTNWRSAACRAAIKTDGTLWLWGCQTASNTRLGTNTTISHSSPVQTVSGGTNWRSVSASSQRTAAIRDEGDY